MKFLEILEGPAALILAGALISAATFRIET